MVNMKLDSVIISGFLCLLLAGVGMYCYATSKEDMSKYCGGQSAGVQVSYNSRRNEILGLSIGMLLVGIALLLPKFKIL